MDAHGSYVALSRHRDGTDLHYGRDDFASQDKLINTLSRDRAKDMATDYERIDPAQDYAERRGITFRARVAQIMRRLMPERVRDAVDDMLDRLHHHDNAAPGREAVQPRDGKDRLQTACSARPRHRQAVRPRNRRMPCAAPAGRHLSAMPVHPMRSLRPSIRALRRPMTSGASLARQGGHSTRSGPMAGRMPKPPTARTTASPARRRRAIPRAIRALQRETGNRLDMQRADEFVDRWKKLGKASEQRYAAGNYSGYKAARAEMGNMTMSLERDPQMEYLLEGRKKQLGIGMDFDSGMRLGRQLSLSHGLGRGRGIGL
jgi:hypothetical protein